MNRKNNTPWRNFNDHKGRNFNILDIESDYKVMFFFPKSFTPGCSQQVCNYRDGIQSIEQLGATVFGVSLDKPEDLERFKNEFNLPYTLLQDPNGQNAKALNILNEASEDVAKRLKRTSYTSRTTLILDQHNEIIKRWDNVDYEKDVENVIEFIEKQEKTD